MDQYDELFIKNIKEDVEQIGYIQDEQTRINQFESIIQKLMLIRDEKIHKNIKQYLEKQKKNDENITNKQHELFELEQQKNKEINKFYDEFLKKL